MLRSTWFAIALFTLVACSSGDTPGNPSAGRVEATGKLTSIQDAVPVDGGVTLVVKDAVGRVTTFHIPSFFTAEPIPPERWELYQHVRTFAVGDAVHARGEPTEYGLLLVSLERVKS